MTHKPDYQRGLDDGKRWAITWLHERARTMNDPHAIAILNVAAFSLGVAARQQCEAEKVK